jgi:NTE family protein
MASSPTTKTAIVLSGGGARGAFEAGVLKNLSQRKKFDIVCGTSIGAINAALTAQQAFDELEQLWSTIATLNVVRYIDIVNRVNSFIDDVEGLRGKLLAALGNFHLVNDWCKIGSKKALLALRGVMDPDPIKLLLEPMLSVNALKSTLIVCATNLTNGTSDAFYSFVNASNDDVARFLAFRAPEPCHILRQVNYLDVVRASASIPGAFEPVRMNLGDPGLVHDYVDGGVANNTPISLAVAAGATEVMVVFLDPVGTTLPTLPTTNLFQIGLASLAVMQQRILGTDMCRAREQGVKITEIRPSKPIELSVLDFKNADGIKAAYQDGLVVGETVA